METGGFDINVFLKKKIENVHLQKSDYLKILVTKNLSPELKQNYVSLDVL